MSIKIKNVSKQFGAQFALKEVSLEIPRGQVLGLLGPNGAGKSTLMRLITGYLPVTSGSVEVCGSPVVAGETGARSSVGYLPERNPLYPDMYVREYLHFVAGMHGLKDAKKRVEQMIQEVGLTPEAHKTIDQLSKGYRQRVGLAQAILHDPEVLILDEPTNGLDPNQLVEIRQLIRRFGKDRTVLLSTHVMQEVEAMCDRVVFIRRGELVGDALCSELAGREGGLEAAFVELTNG